MGSAWLTSPDAASGQAGPDSAVGLPECRVKGCRFKVLGVGRRFRI